MPSTFTWLDYSESERRKMLDVIELFGERATRDELGLGGVRDAFADLLFPGTSTIQTRAKYFLFVPWIYLTLEEKQVAPDRVEHRARKLEVELMNVIASSGDSSGLIGKRARENVRRLASSVYWLGLETWGIRLFPGSEDQYHRSLKLFYARRQGRPSRQDFGGETPPDPDICNWHGGIPAAPPSFPQGITFDLSQPEAEYLRERVLANCPRSFLAHILRTRISVGEVDACWDLAHDVPDVFTEQLTHGRNFSEIMWGAQLLYNLMLAELRPWPEQIDEYREALTEWWELLTRRRDDLRNWDRRRFWQIVRGANPQVSFPAQAFVNQWINAVLVTANVAGIVDGQATRALIDRREYALKRGQSRLKNRRALELWNGAAGAGQMDLRWNAAKSIVSDILPSLGN
ncbi:MAG TPA: DUF6361 family protein [Pirellulales bacterium]|nr:DUF6361 family protein [Pirellulales bacterium]